MSIEHAIDPFAVKAYPKHSPLRIVWTAQSRLLEFSARRRHRLFSDSIKPNGIQLIRERGAPIEDTAVTYGQLELLKMALASVSGVAGDVVEVGSYRGVTTAKLAEVTPRTVYAVDPFIGYGGNEQDHTIFQQRTKGVATISHVRKPSGEAARSFLEESICFVFIDAIHDVSNSWFDFAAWSPKIAKGGLLALHDVDDFPGVGFTLRRILDGSLSFALWGYCPNLAVLKKL